MRFSEYYCNTSTTALLLKTKYQNVTHLQTSVIHKTKQNVI